MKNYLRTFLANALRALDAPDDTPIVLEYPRFERGDLATPVAIAFAAGTGEAPRAAAERIVAELALMPGLEAKITIAHNGFINARFTPAYLRACVVKLVEARQPPLVRTPTVPINDRARVMLGEAARRHAALAGTLRGAIETFGPFPTTADLEALNCAQRLPLMRTLARLDDGLDDGNDGVRRFLSSVCEEVVEFNAHCRVTPEPADARDARLLLLIAVKHAIAEGMAALGVEAPERL